MTLNYETLDVAGSGGQFLSTYTADVGSPAAEKLSILMSWGQSPVEADETNSARSDAGQDPAATRRKD